MKPLMAGILALAAASCSTPPSIDVRDAWTRETVQGQTATAVYLTIVNTGGPDHLLGVNAVRDGIASLHSGTSVDGVARMRAMPEGLRVPAGATLALHPGGNHIMLSGLQHPLNRGERLPLQLHLEKSGTISVLVHVRAADAELVDHKGH